MQRCLCGGDFAIDVGDSLQKDVFRWYASFHCNKCGNSIEMDGSGIDSIPVDIKEQIIQKEGVFGLRILDNKAKANYLMKKILVDHDVSAINGDYIYCGTHNQVWWVKGQLIARGMSRENIEENRMVMLSNGHIVTGLDL